MKLRLNKLTPSLVMAGSVVALVGCGGDAPTLGASSNVVETVTKDDTAAITFATTLVNATGTAGADFPLTVSGTTVVFDKNITDETAGVPPIPTNSTLNLNPTTVTGAIADFKITAPGTDKTVEGYVRPGSCEFVVTGPDITANLLPGYEIGGIYAIQTCAFTIPTTSVLVGAQTSLPPTLTLGTISVEAEQTITIRIEDDGAVTAFVSTTNASGVTTTTPVNLAPAGTVSLTTALQPA